MSTRTIIEINHDRLQHLSEQPDGWVALMRDLGMSTFTAELNKGMEPEPMPGVRILGQRHHSEMLKLTVE